ncbi:MAG TPA: hypothetical protein VGD81_15590, partial [Opitutaceae bacterium]
MNPRSAGFVVALALAVVPVTRAGFFDFFKHDFEVITVTDMTPEGRLRVPPTPANPAYYIPVSLGYRDFGGIVAGIKAPPKEEVYRAVGKVLSKHGFLPATEKTPAPTLLLVFAWGTLNADYDPGVTFEGATFEVQRNRHQILKFLGGYKLGYSEHDFDPLTAMPGLLVHRSYEAQALNDVATEDFYVAVVSAYDLDAARHKQKKLLWMTRMSCPSIGFAMPDVLPAMLEVGGPNIGRETDRPVWVNVSDHFKG